MSMKLMAALSLSKGYNSMDRLGGLRKWLLQRAEQARAMERLLQGESMCEICGHKFTERGCKIICPNCGWRRD